MRIAFISFALLALAFSSGCVYLTDRGNDFADCFTLRAGVKYGLAARIQVTDYFGLGLGWSRGEVAGFIGRDAIKRRETYEAFVWEHEQLPDRPRPALKTGRETNTIRFLVPVGDGFGPRYVFPADFRIESELTLGVLSIALGMNPVEVADFAAGIFGVDFAQDDSFWQSDFERLKTRLLSGTPVERAAAESRLADLKPAGASRILTALLPGIEDDEPFDAVLSTVISIGDPSAPADLKDALTKIPAERRASALEAIAALDTGPDFAPYAESVFAACDNSEDMLAYAALRLLWQRNDAASAEHIAEILRAEHTGFPYWREALDYIAASGSAAACDKIAEILKDPGSWIAKEEDYEFFGTAALAAADLGRTDCVPILKAALSDKTYSDSWRDIAIALGKLGDNSALPLIAQRIGENPRGKFDFALAHLYLDPNTYADEMIDMLRPQKESPAADDGMKDVPVYEAAHAIEKDLEACALLLKAGRPEILTALSELLKSASNPAFEDNYYIFNRVFGKIESAFEEIGGAPRSNDFRTHAYRINALVKYIDRNWKRGGEPLIYWNAEKNKFSARRPK